MEAVNIHVEQRTTMGSRASRQLRRAGKIPSIFYGPKRKALAIILDAKEFESKVAKLEGSHLIRFDSQAPDLRDKMVLVKELQRQPVSRQVLHADFYEVDLSAKIRVTVPLHYAGKAVGVAQGGILQPIKRELAIECLPAEIPEHIEVDVTELGVHGVMHVADLDLAANLVACDDRSETVVTVLAPTVEEAKAEEEAVVAEGAEVPAEEGAAATPTAEGTEEEKN